MINPRLMFILLCCLSSGVLVSAIPVIQQDDALIERLFIAGSETNYLNKGYLAECELAGEQPSFAQIEVAYRMVPSSGSMVLAAIVTNEYDRLTSDVRPAWQRLSSANGSSVLHLELRDNFGGNRLETYGIRLLIYNENTGQLLDSLKVSYPRYWKPDNQTGGNTDRNQPAQETRGQASDEPEARTPVAYEINPQPLAGTPTEDRSGAQAEPIVMIERPTEKVIVNRPQLAQKNTMMLNIRSTSLVELAPGATWDNGQRQLVFNGSSNDASGFVKTFPKATLSDNQTYNNVLQTHPQFIANGLIRGTFNITIPANASSFNAFIGLLSGASRSDGVRYIAFFRVSSSGRQVSLLNQILYYNQGPQEIRVQIPAEIKGQTGQLILAVQALNSSTQDWAVWVDPRIY